MHCSNLLVNSKGHLKLGWIIPYTASIAYCLKHSCLPAEGLSVAPRFCFALACADQMCRKWMISRAAFNHKRQKSVWNVLASVWQGGETSMCVLYRQSHDGIASLPCGTSLLTGPAVRVFFSLWNNPFPRGTLHLLSSSLFLFSPYSPLKPCARFDSPQLHAQTFIPQKVALLWEGDRILRRWSLVGRNWLLGMSLWLTLFAGPPWLNNLNYEWYHEWSCSAMPSLPLWTESLGNHKSK